ncbi:MAG: hypothetical protein LBI99_03220 [Propionibacteriaceae bacterium]|nr:hypothetical protein [Propionibacteriaceae bacterium]
MSRESPPPGCFEHADECAVDEQAGAIRVEQVDWERQQFEEVRQRTGIDRHVGQRAHRIVLSPPQHNIHES